MQNVTPKLNNYEKTNHNVVFACEQFETIYWNSLFEVKLFSSGNTKITQNINKLSMLFINENEHN